MHAAEEGFSGFSRRQAYTRLMGLSMLPWARAGLGKHVTVDRAAAAKIAQVVVLTSATCAILHVLF
jgi:hypothetical protein